MRDRKLKRYLQESFRQEILLSGREETIAGCLQIMREQKRYREEERTGFWIFLSDIFRFEGMAVFVLQAGVLFLACMGLGITNGIAGMVPVFTPFFALAVMPTLFRSRFYGMEEMEAATRSSGTEIILAKLILSGAANLVCLTILFCLEMYLQKTRADMGRIILYGLVPYLFCMTLILRLVRMQRRENMAFCVGAAVSAGAVWGISAKVLPGLYEASATGLWVILFAAFVLFFGKEIYFLLEMRREGRSYGIIG